MKRAAEVLNSCVSEIMDTWENTVKDEISASSISSELALRNQLPHLLKDIASILDRYEGFSEVDKQEKFEEVVKNSMDHGRHRATSSHYTVEQIIREYIIFHRVLTDVLIQHEVYFREVGIILKYSLEMAMLNSARSFNDSLQEMREKLVGTLAHDIRNPISAAYFSLDVMEFADTKERFDSLKKMGINSLQKSLDLLEGLLDAISVKAGEGITLNFEEMDIAKEVKWVYNEASEIYNSTINYTCKSDKIIGVFDGTAIRRVTENLVTNAIKYGEREKPVSIIVEDLGENIVIKVHNFGNPIPKREQETIFKFLNRLQGSGSGDLQGWGMGLTLVKSVARAHGGKVELESDEEKGTTFSLFLDKHANKPGKIKTELNYISNKTPNFSKN